MMWCCWVSSDTCSTLHGCFRARSFEKKAMSRMAGLLVDGEGRRDSTGSRIFSGGNREEGRGRGVWGAGTGAPGPALQGVELEKSQELTFSLRTDPIGMLKYDPQAWIFIHCKAGRTKYTLLSRRANLSQEGRQSLEALLKANRRLDKAYLLKEMFSQLWDYKREVWARRFFDRWRSALRWQRLKPYEGFARMVEEHWDGIASHCHEENKVPLGFVEGINNKIRVIQRRAYGLRDEEYLRLKILTCMLPEI